MSSFKRSIARCVLLLSLAIVSIVSDAAAGDSMGMLTLQDGRQLTGVLTASQLKFKTDISPLPVAVTVEKIIGFTDGRLNLFGIGRINGRFVSGEFILSTQQGEVHQAAAEVVSLLREGTGNAQNGTYHWHTYDAVKPVTVVTEETFSDVAQAEQNTFLGSNYDSISDDERTDMLRLETARNAELQSNIDDIVPVSRIDNTVIGTSGGGEKSESLSFNHRPRMTTIAGETPKIEQSTAATLIREHVSNSYTIVHIGTFPLKEGARKGNSAEDIYEKFGLVTVEYKAKKKFSSPLLEATSIFEDNRAKIITKLTRKGERMGAPVRKKDNESPPETGFPAGKLIVDRIVSISQDNIVLFSITHKANELGKRLGIKDEKLRGKAEFIYDPFLVKFIFIGFWVSDWKVKKWENYYWLKKTQAKNFLIFGPDTTLSQPTQQITPNYSPSSKLPSDPDSWKNIEEKSDWTCSRRLFGGCKNGALPLPEITSEVLQNGDTSDIHIICQYDDYDCVLKVMRETGAGDQALRFFEHTGAFVFNFQELGKIDLVSAEAAFAANVIHYELLVNGKPNIVSLGSNLTEADRNRPDIRQLRKKGIYLLFNDRFVRKESLAQGIRYIVEADFAKCNACRNEVFARAEFAHDVDSKGVYQGYQLLRVLPSLLNAGATENLRIGEIHDTSPAGDCYCHFHPILPNEKIVPNQYNRYLFISDSMGKAWMNINGQDVEFVSKQCNSGSQGGLHFTFTDQRCDEHALYIGAGMNVQIDLQATKRCPPEPTECEVTDYDATITVEKEGLRKMVKAKGSCGC